MTTGDTKDLDKVAVVALAKVNRLANRADWIRNFAVIALLIVAITFSVLGYVKITNLIAVQNQRAKDNHLLLSTIQADDAILKTATGPGTVAASTRQIHCIINRIDVDANKAALDRSCPTFDD